MSLSRRNFIKQSSLTLAGTSLLQTPEFAGLATKGKMGVQLYSVRDDMSKDPLGTLKAISKMGYKYVEHANYSDRKFYGYAVKDFKKILSDLGMQMKTGHTVLGPQHWDETEKDFTDVWKYTVEDAAAMGQEFVISPWLDDSWRKTGDVLKSYMGVFNKSGKLCKKHGMKFGYHNHDFEFSQKFDGVTVFDLIMRYTDPALVSLQLDTGNMFHAGAKAEDIVKKYPGRFETIHVKDEIKTGDNKFESTLLGKGIVPVKKISELARAIGGTRYFIVEQEAYQGLQPLDTIRKNFATMSKWGYK